MTDTTSGAATTAGQPDPLAPRPREGHFHGLDRWDVLAMVRDLRKELGITDRDIAVLAAHLAVLPKGHVSAPDLLMSYAAVGSLLNRANGMDERRFRRGEARLEEIGLVTRRLSANGRRFPLRNAAGRIVDAYGIDLRPLFLQAEDLRRRVALVTEKRIRKTAYATRISCTLSELRRYLERELGSVPPALIDLAQYARRITRRNTATIAELSAIESEVERFAAAYRERRAGATDEASPPDPTEGLGRIASTGGAIARETVTREDSRPCALPAAAADEHAPQTAKRSRCPTDRGAHEAPTVSCEAPSDRPDVLHMTGRSSADDGRNVRRTESHTKDIYYRRQKSPAPDPLTVWQNCSEIRSFYPVAPRTLHDLLGVIGEVSTFLGLGPDQVQRTLAVFGAHKMILVLDYLASRVHEIGQLRGYLSSMLKRYQAGEDIAGGRVRPSRDASHIETWPRP